MTFIKVSPHCTSQAIQKTFNIFYSSRIHYLFWYNHLPRAVATQFLPRSRFWLPSWSFIQYKSLMWTESFAKGISIQMQAELCSGAIKQRVLFTCLAFWVQFHQFHPGHVSATAQLLPNTGTATAWQLNNSLKLKFANFIPSSLLVLLLSSTIKSLRWTIL